VQGWVAIGTRGTHLGNVTQTVRVAVLYTACRRFKSYHSHVGYKPSTTAHGQQVVTTNQGAVVKEEIAKQWINALRSGEYTQGHGALKRESRHSAVLEFFVTSLR
jgi:hypothetical protein